MKFSHLIPNSRSKTAKVAALIAAVVLPSALAYAGYLAYTRFERKKYIKKIKDVLFLGDSQSVTDNSYADLVSKNMDWNYDKISKVGAKTDYVLNEYRGSTNNYDAVVVMIGGNDVWARGNSSQAIQNLKEIKALARKRQQLVIFISPPSKRFYSLDSTKLSEYDKIRKWMKSNADLFVDGTSVTDSENLFLNDKLHLNLEGQNQIAYHFTEALREL